MNARLVRVAIATALATTFAVPSFAQTAVGSQADTQRNVEQQQRIENGLRSGQLSTREAGRLERGEARVEKLESKADRNGSVSAAEQSRITAAQNRESRAIHDQKHDAQVGNPDSASSRRMQADVQRNENQQARIAEGERTGQLSTREAGSLERGQSRVDRATARAARDGRVGAHEQVRLQAREDRQSTRIAHRKHNRVTG